MKPLLFFMCTAFTIQLQAQNRTNVWELSYIDTIVLGYPNCEMRYQNGIMDTIGLYRVMAFTWTDASICDTNGNLLFYSNGLTIGNRNYDTMQNAVDFNPGFATDFYEPVGMGLDQGVLIIPLPDHPDKYYIFSVSAEILTSDIQPVHLSYSVIDMNLDGGLGGIIAGQKNLYAIEDTLTLGGLTAVKHANGIDWWVIAHEYATNKFYTLLITSDGIVGSFEQQIGDAITNDVVVQSTFSSDGSKFCFSNWGGWFEYLQFDRCNGQFSNPVIGHSPDTLAFAGNSFSPNGRFLYVSSLFNLYQYDTWDSNMIDHVIHVAAWDTFYQTFQVLFSMHQLAPDGKIYISPWNGVSILNVINSPDSLGLSCNFAPHSYYLPQWTLNIPSFPNYDLDSLPGSDSCNAVYTSTTKPPNPTSSFKITPNPVSHWLNIIYNTPEDASFSLFDLYGKKERAISLFHYFKNRLVDVSDLPAGIYLAVVTQKGKQVWSEKVVVGH